MKWTLPGTGNLRYALRMSRKTPAWTVTAVVTLALGIGATLTTYTLVDHLLLRPLPWDEAARLVRVYQDNEARGIERNSVSPPNFLDWRRESTSFESMAAWTPTGVTLAGAGSRAERLTATFASAELFGVLRVSPALGRTFDSSENVPGHHRVAVLSHGLFLRRFGGDPDVLGTSVAVNGESVEVIGVMPPGFDYPEEEEPAIWLPFAFEPDAHRGAQYLRVVGRLRDGVTLEQARAEMRVVADRLREANPGDGNCMGVNVFPLHEDQVRDVRGVLLLLFGAVALLLAIACANVAHLLLARLHDRRRELAVRTALGASRSHLLAQMLAEAALLAGPGALLGLLLTQWTLDAFVAFLPEALPELEQMVIDGRVLSFTLLLTAATTAAFALLPALTGSRRLGETLRDASARASAGPRRFRFGQALIAGETALAVTLAVGAGLLAKSLAELTRLDPGFRTDGVIALRVGLPEARYDTLGKTAGFFDQVLAEARALPGADSASAVGWLPLGGVWDCSFNIDGRPLAAGEPDNMGLFRPVGTDYFRTMGIPLKRGRTFDARDRAGAEPVIVIDEALAAKYFPGSDPVGRKMRFHCGDDDMRTIVGVVGNVRQRRLTEDHLPGYYIPYSQLYWDEMTVVVRTSAEPGPLIEAIRDDVRALDPELAVYGVETLRDRVGRALSRPRLQSLLFGGFAVMALLLGAAGVYGVMACSVARRRYEMGVRAALGARARDLVRQVLGEGMALAGAGVALGLGLAFALSRLFESLLFGVSSTDPGVFALSPAVLAATALLACWAPARRAGRVDVVRMLRID